MNPKTAPKAAGKKKLRLPSGKYRRTRHYELQIADSTEAAQKLDEATSALRVALATPRDPAQDGDSPAVVQAKADLEQARANFAACFQRISFQAISAAAFTALVKAHPPVKRGDEWNPETFQPALIAGCAKDIDMTAEQWRELLDGDDWSVADRNAIFGVALAVNLETTDQQLLSAMLGR